MQKSGIAVTPIVGTTGSFAIDLPLEPVTLNERLFDIGIWLSDHEISHQARILMQPERRCIRVSFPDARDAMAFRERFGTRLDSGEISSAERHNRDGSLSSLDCSKARIVARRVRVKLDTK